MAEANPEPLPHDAAAASDSVPSKHPDESSASNDAEIEDTASSKKPKKDVIQVVEIDNIHMMHEILSFRNQIGVYPCYSPYDFQGFCRFYIEMGIGNEDEWSKRMEDMKNKFNNESDPTEEIDKKEFELWKKIWGNERMGDGYPGLGSRN